MTDIYIFGTCRLCYPIHEDIKFIKELRCYHSRYYKINNNIHIYTEPVNYTTKLIDVLDSILYMKGKLYNNLNPVNDKILQSIFFRGHKTVKDTILPQTHPSMVNKEIVFSKIIIEIFSIKQYIINTKKYGEQFYLQNLPWKIHTTYEHNDIKFDKNDLITKIMNKEECFDNLDKIQKEVNCDILIIGPYVSKFVPDTVNNERIKTQEILKEYSLLNKKIKYFDLSETIQLHNIETDETHFNEYGRKIIGDVIYDFIVMNQI